MTAPPSTAEPVDDVTRAPVPVFLLHSDALTCAGLHLLLAGHPTVEVVGRGDRLGTALPGLRRHRPRVLLLGFGGDLAVDLAAVRRLRSDDGLAPEPPRVLLLRRLGTCAELTQILNAGACGALQPDIDPCGLAEAVSVAARGGVVFLPTPPPTPQGSLLPGEEPPQAVGLTRRERAVLGALARGLSNAEIARELALAEATVKRYLTQAMRKIGQPDRLRAGLYAYRHGLYAA